MEEELKPCPYCGETPEVRLDEVVWCPSCGLQGPEGDSEEDVIAAWNALPRRLKWTKEWPQDYHPGHYYLFCFPPSKTSICRYVDVPPDELKSEMIRDWPHLSPQEIENIEWAGPIPEPLPEEP